jgi:hypothetical protein
MILAKLDRVFISTKWGATSPLARVIGLEKKVSDHVPLMLDLGGNCERAKKKFRFEKWWLERVEFAEVVNKAWGEKCASIDPLEI